MCLLVFLPFGYSDFNPRPPRGGRPKGRRFTLIPSGISIHAPREGGDLQTNFYGANVWISIHAPREGGDAGVPVCARPPSDISIHAPREGGDRSWSSGPYTQMHFNPRPPRGGRLFHHVAALLTNMISIHAPREGGDCIWCGSILPPWIISIHAPREGGDIKPMLWTSRVADFNPRPPRGGRRCIQPLSFSSPLFQSTPPARGATAKMHSFTCGSLTNK